MAITSSKLAFWHNRIPTNSQRPITADVFLTDFCNNKCHYCRYGHESGGYMPFEDFKRYVVRLQSLGVKGIILTGGGEPTINPDFDKITAWLEECGIDHGINTNFVKYVECKPRYLKISIDAGDEEEYCKLRGVDKFGQVVENLQRYLKWRDEVGADTNVIIQCLPTSKEQAERFYRAFKDVPGVSLQFRPFEGQNPVISPAETDEVVNYISNIARAGKNVGKSFKFDMMGKRFSKCYANWSVVCLRHDGMVLYCCHRPDAVIGHIMEDGILDRKASFEVDMAKCDVPCRLSGANAYLESLITERDRNFV